MKIPDRIQIVGIWTGAITLCVLVAMGYKAALDYAMTHPGWTTWP